MSEQLKRIRIGKGSRIVAERWYYDPTYLHGPDKKDGLMLFVRHFALVETKSGKRDVRVRINVEVYANSDLMAAAIEDRDMVEVPQEFDDDRGWRPPDLLEIVSDSSPHRQEVGQSERRLPMRLTVPLPPAHYERPRPNRDHSKFYSPHTASLDEWRMLLTNQMRLGKHGMIEGPVTVEMTVSPTETIIQVGPAQGVTRPAGVKADLDNIVKFVLDALEEAAYFDDLQVVHIRATFVPSDKENKA